MDVGGDTLGTSYGYASDNALTKLEHMFVEPVGVVTDARYDFGYNAVNQITQRDITNTSYVYQSTADEAKVYTTNGLNQYTGICTDDGAGGCLTNTTTNIGYDVSICW